MQITNEEFINSKGNLDNYHSANYTISDKGILELKKELITPYFERKIEDIRDIIDITCNSKRDKKQYDKWITFNCEFCGTETEQLKSRYNKNKTHCCSSSCSAKLRNMK
jgi:hypothetical protein